MEWKDQITIDPAVLAGKPVVKGTRIAVEFIIDLLGQGWSEQEVLRNYPGLTYAGETLHAEKIYPIRVAS